MGAKPSITAMVYVAASASILHTEMEYLKAFKTIVLLLEQTRRHSQQSL